MRDLSLSNYILEGEPWHGRETPSFLFEEEQEQQELTAAEVTVSNNGFSSAVCYSPPPTLHSISNAAAARPATINPALAGRQWWGPVLRGSELALLLI